MTGRMLRRALASPLGRQLSRYSVVGIAANLLCLAVYYGLTLLLGLGPKLALTIASAIGFIVAFAANRHWTFKAAGPAGASLPRYAAGYLGSFALQYLILHVGVDRLGLAHELVVLFGLACASIAFFLVQKIWVFAPAAARPDQLRRAGSSSNPSIAKITSEGK